MTRLLISLFVAMLLSSVIAQIPLPYPSSDKFVRNDWRIGHISGGGPSEKFDTILSGTEFTETNPSHGRYAQVFKVYGNIDTTDRGAYNFQMDKNITSDTIAYVLIDIRMKSYVNIRNLYMDVAAIFENGWISYSIGHDNFLKQPVLWWKDVKYDFGESHHNDRILSMRLAFATFTDTLETIGFEVVVDNLRLVYPDGKVVLVDDFGDTLQGGTVDVVPEKVIPNTITLSQNYPNPFNPSTVINFSLPHEAFVDLKVYNMLGQEVATLAHGSMFSGSHRATFDAKNLPTGVYVYTLRVDNKIISTKKMLFVK